MKRTNQSTTTTTTTVGFHCPPSILYMMAVVSVSGVTSYKDQLRPMNVTKQIERGMPASRCFSPLIIDGGRQCVILHTGYELFGAKQRRSVNMSCMVNTSFIPFQSSKEVPPFCNTYSYAKFSGSAYQRAKMCSGFYELGKGSCERQLKALDSYFGKLQDEKNNQLSSSLTMSKLGTDADTLKHQVESSSQLERKMTEMFHSTEPYIMSGLGSLENYFSKLNTGTNTKNSASPTSDEELSNLNPERIPIIRKYHDRATIDKRLESTDNGSGPMHFGDENIHGLSTYDETSGCYIVSFLAAINIAVFLFEIASPIRSSDIEQLSLPLIYGGKINKLILVGEWWRLLTPMFLGPVFALIGAWLVYQLRNKEVIPKERSESMFWKAVIATALSFILSNFGIIDDWTHLGATLSGIIFGYVTCPTLELGDASSSKNGQQEDLAFVRRQTDLFKSLIIFTLSIIILSFLVFYYGVPQLEILEGVMA